MPCDGAAEPPQPYRVTTESADVAPARRQGLMGLQRLRQSTDIRAVVTARQVVSGTAMVLHARRRSATGDSRAAVVAGRKIGGAVARNRAKRRLRAALRDTQLGAGIDYVVVARPAALTMPFPVLQDELTRLSARAGQRLGAAG